MHFSAKRRIREHCLHHVLAIVECSRDGDVGHVRRQHGCHLAALHFRRAFMGVQDDDIDAVPVGAGLDRGGAGIAGRGANDGDPFVAFG